MNADMPAPEDYESIFGVHDAMRGIKPMSKADILVKQLRDAVNLCFDEAEACVLMNDAADMIEQMAQRIEADDKRLQRVGATP